MLMTANDQNGDRPIPEGFETEHAYHRFLAQGKKAGLTDSEIETRVKALAKLKKPNTDE
jgi:hypothetical protein